MIKLVEYVCKSCDPEEVCTVLLPESFENPEGCLYPATSHNSNWETLKKEEETE